MTFSSFRSGALIWPTRDLTQTVFTTALATGVTVIVEALDFGVLAYCATLTTGARRE